MPDIKDPQTGAVLSSGGAVFPLLLTDGSVIVQNVNTQVFHADGKVFKLKPDINGSYVNGHWSRVASLPYIPFASAQAVLADGRVIIEGGEFTGVFGDFTLTNKGAIYDPVTNSWTRVAPPPFFVDLYPPRAAFAPNPIGDAASVVLPDGTFMLQDKMSRQAALLDLQTMTWTETGTATKFDLNDEEGWTLLPNGKVLTVDCYTDFTFGLIAHYPADPTNSELYDPQTGTWVSAGSTINTLTDRRVFETGPAVLRPDGTVFAVGSQGYTSIYDSRTGTWSAGPRLPRGLNGHRLTAQAPLERCCLTATYSSPRLEVRSISAFLIHRYTFLNLMGTNSFPNPQFQTLPSNFLLPSTYLSCQPEKYSKLTAPRI
jgi:hypothetical protein